MSDSSSRHSERELGFRCAKHVDVLAEFGGSFQSLEIWARGYLYGVMKESQKFKITGLLDRRQDAKYLSIRKSKSAEVVYKYHTRIGPANHQIN